MDDIDEELAEIKREIVESRGLVIKTNNLTSALASPNTRVDDWLNDKHGGPIGNRQHPDHET